MPTTVSWRGDDARLALSDVRELARRVRRQQRATWFPLLMFAALTFASIPVRRYSGHHLDCQAVLVPLTVSGIQPGTSWYSLPAVVQGSLLLLGGLAFALVQRSLRTPPP